MSCLTCNSETDNPKYCSRSCAAKHTNKSTPKRAKTKTCKSCNSMIASSREYCAGCWPKVRSTTFQHKVDLWLSGNWRGGSDFGLSSTIRRHLLKEANYSCSRCGFDTLHPVDGSPILEINHVDGDGTNHSPSNLEVLCPNCHALTDTYRGRNFGKGRRKFRYS